MGVLARTYGDVKEVRYMTRSGTDRRAPREKGSVEQDIGAPGLDTQGGFTAASAGPTPFALRDLRVAAGRGERSYCAQCVGEASQGGEA